MICISQFTGILQCKKNAIINYLLAFCFMVLTFLGNGQVRAQSVSTINDSLYALVNNQKALRLIYASKLDDSKQLLNNILQKRQNALSYYLLAHIYNTEENWEEAIKEAQKSIQLDPNFMPSYTELFNGYSGANKWKEAVGISDKAQKGDGSGYIATQLQSLQSSVDLENLSHLLFPFFFLVIAVVFFLPLFRKSKNETNFPATSGFRFSEILLLSAGVSCSLRYLFYALSAWIWSFNPHIQASEFAPPRFSLIFEHDGLESYSLYLLMFLNITATLLILPLLLKLKANKNLYIIVFSILLLISGYYFFDIGFFPPSANIGSEGSSHFLPVFITVVAFSIGLYWLYGKYKGLTKWLMVILIAFVSLVTIYPSSLGDLSYILAPGLRLFHGFKVKEIYFQYDLYLSFLAYAFMKLNIELSWFPYLSQVSFFLFFIGSFFFAERFFKTKGLSVFFIIALMLIRYYGPGYDNPGIFQVTPLRLDLWIIPLLLVYSKGVYHWSVGVCLGLLVLFHRNLGIIYSVAYLELAIVLFLLGVISLIKDNKVTIKMFPSFLREQMKLNFKNLLIIIFSFALCFILFGELFSKSALNYTKLGISMLRISNISFYWYVPVLLSSLAVFLVYCKNKFGEKYVTAGLFIILLVIGDSMYFFGRSHENNLLNISGILVLTLFVLFDILIFTSPEPESVVIAKNTTVAKNKKATPTPQEVKPSYFTQRNAATFLPVVFIIFIVYFYSERITEKASAQYTNFKESQLHFPLLPQMDIASIKKVTHNSPNVYFLDHLDFYYCYYGDYVPQGYFSPLAGYAFKKDLQALLQDLLKKGYYIVYDEQKFNTYNEYFPYLKFNHTQKESYLVSLKYDTVKPLLPDDKASLFHIEIEDSLIKQGMDRAGIEFADEFTIETVIKAVGSQAPNAMILNNLTRFDGLRGLTFQRNGSIPNQYVFAISNGTPNMPNAVFQLDDNKWHYVAVTVNKTLMKVYDNGKLLSTVNVGGLPTANSEVPLTIGNQAGRDAHFSGYIREVKISNGAPAEIDIINTGQKLDAELNSVKVP